MNQIHTPSSSAEWRIAFVHACWHQSIVDRGRDGFIAEMKRLGHGDASIDAYPVPGSLEIPLHAKLLAASGDYDAIVAAGFVVDGGIYRHDFVAQSVIDGLMRVQLDTDIPVLSMVLTPQRFHEHAEHIEFFTTHMVSKGAEAARACADTLRSLSRLRQRTPSRAA